MDISKIDSPENFSFLSKPIHTSARILDLWFLTGAPTKEIFMVERKMHMGLLWEKTYNTRTPWLNSKIQSRNKLKCQLKSKWILSRDKYKNSEFKKLQNHTHQKIKGYWVSLNKTVRKLQTPKYNLRFVFSTKCGIRVPVNLQQSSCMNGSTKKMWKAK